MERLYIHCKVGGKITVKSANAMRVWNEKYARFQDSYKKAWIQKYPKKDNPPLLLADNVSNKS